MWGQCRRRHKAGWVTDLAIVCRPARRGGRWVGWTVSSGPLWRRLRIRNCRIGLTSQFWAKSLVTSQYGQFRYQKGFYLIVPCLNEGSLCSHRYTCNKSQWLLGLSSSISVCIWRLFSVITAQDASLVFSDQVTPAGISCGVYTLNNIGGAKPERLGDPSTTCPPRCCYE